MLPLAVAPTMVPTTVPMVPRPDGHVEMDEFVEHILYDETRRYIKGHWTL